MSDDEKRAIVADNGSGYSKVGFAGDPEPGSVFPTVIGRQRFDGSVANRKLKDFYVGNAALTKRTLLKLKHPIEHGIVKDWDDMELIWKHMFEMEMRVDPKERYFLSDFHLFDCQTKGPFYELQA